MHAKIGRALDRAQVVLTHGVHLTYPNLSGRQKWPEGEMSLGACECWLSRLRSEGKPVVRSRACYDSAPSQRERESGTERVPKVLLQTYGDVSICGDTGQTAVRHHTRHSFVPIGTQLDNFQSVVLTYPHALAEASVALRPHWGQTQREREQRTTNET